MRVRLIRVPLLVVSIAGLSLPSVVSCGSGDDGTMSDDDSGSGGDSPGGSGGSDGGDGGAAADGGGSGSGGTSTDGSGGTNMGSGGIGLGGEGNDGSGGVTQEPIPDPCQALEDAQDFCNTRGDEFYMANASLEPGCHVFGELDVAATVTVKGDSAMGPTVIIAETIDIRMGGDLNASAQGFPGDMGPGAGAANEPYGSGAGHGGKGGDRGVPGGTTYGDPKYPVTHGSGGGNAGGRGGGAILVCARSSMTINGEIKSNGGGSAANGAGSGGSVLVIAPSVEGTGVIEAKGGLASNSICGGSGASGGGGRVAIRTADDKFLVGGEGSIDVTSPTSCSQGAAGTQYAGPLPEGE